MGSILWVNPFTLLTTYKMPFETSEISFGTSIQNWNLGHYKRTEAYASAIDRLYQTAIADFSRLATRTKVNPKKAFSFEDYPMAKREAAKIVSGLTGKMKAVVEVGSREEWLYANKKADSFLKSILDTSKLDKKRLSGYQDRNLNALKTFQKRKVNGMNLSQRVWKYTDQFKQTMELGIDVGLGEGRSAQELARDLKSNLLEPDKLFRRVRDKRGNLQLSKAAKAFHPGQGVYRSSYKNAMRLVRSEINMAYRTSDNLRWGQLDFVVGFEVKLSNNHTLNGEPFRDICDDLAGKYPKTFKFNGWHPQCRCYSVPILQDPDEFNTDELNELKSALNGKEYRKYVSKNTVRDVPNNFKTWARDNQKKIDGYKSTPYFVKDNFRYGKIRNGLKLDAGPVKPSTQAKIPFSSEPKLSPNFPKELMPESDYVKGTDISFKNEFFKLLDDNKKVKLHIKSDIRGSFYDPRDSSIHIANTQRAKKSLWHRESVVYHEFGHAVDFQKNLRFRLEVSKLMKDYKTKLSEKISVRGKAYKIIDGEYKIVDVAEKISKIEAVSKRLDEVYRRVSKISDSAFTKRGISKQDVLEQIGATQDTIMSINPRFGWGHSAAYFRRIGAKEAEFIAHAFENSFTGNTVFKKYLPDLYDDMVRLIGDITK